MADQIFLLDAAKTTLRALSRTTVQALGMKEADVEGWLAKLGGPLFGRDLLWVARQTWASDELRSDLLGVDRGGALVVAELKRGVAGPDSLTQALGYASRYARLGLEELARLWLETGKKESGLVAQAPATLEDASERLKARAPSPELNSQQIVLIVAEGFDENLLSTCSYLSEALEESQLAIECWEYIVHLLGDGAAGHVITLRQVVPSRTVRDEIAARQELRGEKLFKRRNRLKHSVADAVAADGWQRGREEGRRWYSLSLTKAPLGTVWIEFNEGDRPVLYLPPGVSIDGEPPPGVEALGDWMDAKDATVWKRHVFSFASTASYETAQGQLVRSALAKLKKAEGAPVVDGPSPAAG